MLAQGRGPNLTFFLGTLKPKKGWFFGLFDRISQEDQHLGGFEKKAAQKIEPREETGQKGKKGMVNQGLFPGVMDPFPFIKPDHDALCPEGRALGVSKGNQLQ